MDKVVHFEIPVNDIKRAEKFYKSAFGWEINSIPEMKYTLVTTSPVDEKKMHILNSLKISEEESHYFISTGSIVNHAYDSNQNQINILYKDGTVKNIVDASDLMNISALSVPVKKYYLCYVKS